MRLIPRALAALLLACASAAAVAADRVALLIGNNQYATQPLRNAVNDAKDLGEALKELGFKVIVRENTTRKDMIDAIKEFGAALDGASTALFFYAGHAMQFKDRNYLIPIDAAMGSEEDVTFASLEVGQVFDRMDRARTRFNFVVLDACRDNPFASSFKLTSVGLAQMSAPSGTMIAYATAPGSVAADGFQRNGVYTKHILQNIKVPDLPAEIMFKRVRDGVERETKKLQTPWESSSLKGDFAFNATGRPATTAAAPAGPSADAAINVETVFWTSVRDSNRADDIQAYLDKYPSGNFAPLARNKLDALLGRSRPGAQLAQSGGGSASPSVAAAMPAESRSAASTPATSTAPNVPAVTPPVAATLQPAVPQAAPPTAAKPEPPTQVAAVSPSTVPAARDPAASRPAIAPDSAPSSPARPAASPSSPPTPPASASPAATSPGTAAASAPASTPPAPAKPDTQPGREIAPGVREVAFADGAIYRGALRGASLHGRGEYVSKNFKYEGEFVDGLKHGQGVYVWENGDRYEGVFAGDRPDGKGKYQFANGDTYEGEVKAGTIVGRGTYASKNGDVFDGSFVDGKPHGIGVYRFASGDRYEGEMVHGAPQGKGRYVAQNGDRVEGTFVAGRPHGKGIYRFANGDRYEGEIQAGELTGTGTYFYGTGLRYEGEMRAGQPQGKGVFWFLDGSRFEGAFDGGLARAKGEIVDREGNRVPAEIVDGNARRLN